MNYLCTDKYQPHPILSLGFSPNDGVVVSIHDLRQKKANTFG
jgi:hypothetical protein